MELGLNYMAATDFIMVSEVTSLHLSLTLESGSQKKDWARVIRVGSILDQVQLQLWPPLS